MDLITLASAKKYADKLAAGFKSVRIDGMKLIFTLLDDTETTIVLPAPSDGKDGVSVTGLSIDKDGSLLCYMSDGNIIDAGHVPAADVKLTDYYTKEEIDDLLIESGSDLSISWNNIQDKPFESESLEKEMFNETLTFNSCPGNNRNYYVAEGEYLDGIFDGSSCSVYFNDIKRSGIVSEIEPWRNEDYCAVIGNPSITDEIIYT